MYDCTSRDLVICTRSDYRLFFGYSGAAYRFKMLRARKAITALSLGTLHFVINRNI